MTIGTAVEPLVLLLLSCCVLVSADTGVLNVVVADAVAIANAAATWTATNAALLTVTVATGAVAMSAAAKFVVKRSC